VNGVLRREEAALFLPKEASFPLWGRTSPPYGSKNPKRSKQFFERKKNPSGVSYGSRSRKQNFEGPEAKRSFTLLKGLLFRVTTLSKGV